MAFTTNYDANLLRRIHEFLVRQPVTIVVGDLKQPMADLESLLGEMGKHEQTSDARRRTSIAETGRIRTLALAARENFLIPLVSASKHVFPPGSNLRTALKYRREKVRPLIVLRTLRSMADAAAPYAPELAAAGFAADFAQRMNAAADELGEAIDARAKAIGLRAAATLGKNLTVNRARTLVRLLDSLVAPRLKGTPLFAEWKSLLRQGRVRISPPAGEEQDPTPTPAPEPAPVSVATSPDAPPVHSSSPAHQPVVDDAREAA